VKLEMPLHFGIHSGASHDLSGLVIQLSFGRWTPERMSWKHLGVSLANSEPAALPEDTWAWDKEFA
jgi:hypothetical protein